MRSLVRCVPSAAAMLQCLVATYLLLSKVIPVSCTNAEGSCPSVVYLTVGEKGKIPCLCGNFTIVSWYIGEEHEAGRYPVINYDKVQKRGYGYTAGEYDIEENGTLIIMTVKRQHEGYFVVTVADDIQRREETINIEVIVIVPAVPSYPVVNDKISQQHVYMDVNTDGMLRCAMFGVHPAINLTWTSQSNKISFQNDDLIKTPRENDTFDISLTTHYSVTDLTLERVTIYCEVADEIAEYFPDKAIVDLLLSSLYPVVNGHINQEHVYLDVEREGYLTCLKENVDVGTRLVWELLDPTMQDRVTFQSARVISENNDGTVNINQTVHYKIDYSVKRIMFECRVMEPDTNKHPLATKVDLLFENVYPVVNGHISQEHVYLEVEREGYLTCLKENVDVGTRLVWELLDPTMQDRVTFQSVRVISNNIDGTVNINQTFDYEVNDISLERITVECKVMEPDTDPLVTRVDLLFQDVYPVVNGHISQEHVYLEVEREGYLTCLKENVDVGTRLVWELLDPTMQDRVTFQSVRVISNNIDGTVNINQTFDYEVNDISLERITVECKVMEPDTDPLATKVDLLFQNVYPVVNGRVNQNHVHLDVDREGHLTCWKENVDVGTRLVWQVLDSTMRDKITFHSNQVISNNNDGTININQTFDYVVHDKSLERIAIECGVVEPNTAQHPFVTRVELLFDEAPSPLPVPTIYGCYHQLDHCVLEVEMTGELTCTVRNSYQLVDLKWTTLGRDQMYMVFEESKVNFMNYTDFFDISITTPYTVIDESVTSVNVRCDACRSDSGEVLSSAKTSLLIQTASDSNNNYKSSHFGVSLSTLLLIIGLVLIVIILWYCNRKMYMRSEGKCSGILCTGSRPGNEYGYPIPEATINENPPCTVGGLPVMCSRDVCATDAPEGPEKAESTDFPDSGNSSSLSTEQSGSEPSEKCGLMEDVQMSCIYSKQGSMDGKRGCSEGDQMA